jgi:branched-chain amino acid transport system substrate-binding protein
MKVLRLLVPLFLLALVLVSCQPKQGESVSELRIGCLLPLSDVPSHQYGIWAREGIDLAVDEINAKGGIDGKKLVIDYQDDLGSGDQAVVIMSKFTSVNKYPVVFSYVSQPSSAVAPIARDTKTVLVTNTYTPGITDNNEYVFRIGHNAGTDSRVMAQFLKSQLGGGTLAIVYIKTASGDRASEILQQTYESLGGTVVGKISYAADEPDFKPLLLKIKSLNPKVIYIYPYKEVGTIVSEIRRLNIPSVITTNNAIEEPVALKEAGSAADGVIFTSPQFDPNSTDPLITAYQEHFKAKYGVASEVSSATWYDTVNIVCDAIRRGGYTSEGIRQALLQVKDYHGVAGVVTLRDDRDVDKPVAVKVIRNGKSVPWEGPSR